MTTAERKRKAEQALLDAKCREEKRDAKWKADLEAATAKGPWFVRRFLRENELWTAIGAGKFTRPEQHKCSGDTILGHSGCCNKATRWFNQNDYAEWSSAFDVVPVCEKCYMEIVALKRRQRYEAAEAERAAKAVEAERAAKAAEAERTAAALVQQEAEQHTDTTLPDNVIPFRRTA